MEPQRISRTADDSEHSDANEKEIRIGTTARINYIAIVLAVLIIVCSFFVPFFRKGSRILMAALILIWEAIARPFSEYGVSSKGLSEYRFGKKVRLIQWQQIKQVGKQLDKLALGSRPGLIITLQGAPLYDKYMPLSSFRYFKVYRPNVLYIYGYYEVISVIEKFYGPADYTKKADLPG